MNIEKAHTLHQSLKIVQLGKQNNTRVWMVTPFASVQRLCRSSNFTSVKYERDDNTGTAKEQTVSAGVCRCAPTAQIVANRQPKAVI